MRVRIITSTSFPDGMAATSRIRCYAKALQKGQIDVNIVSTHGINIKKGKSVLYEGINDGVQYTLLLNKKIAGKIANYAWSSFKAFLLVIHTIINIKKYDVCLIYNSATWPNLFLASVLKMVGKKTVLEMNEYPYAPDGNKITRYVAIKKYLRCITFKLVFPLLDGIIVISDRLEKVALKYAPGAKILKVPILTEEIPVYETLQNYADKVYLFHAGSLNEKKDGIVNVFEAFGIAHQELIKKHGVESYFYITKDTTYAETLNKIEQVINKYNVNDFIVITGFLSDHELKKIEQGALALVLNKPSTFQNKYNFPTKLSSYLISGTPVIVAAENLELNKFLENGANALITKPDDYSNIAKQIVYCFENPEISKIISKNAYSTVVREFYYVNHIERLRSYFNSFS